MRVGGLFGKADDAPLRVTLKDAEAAGILGGYRVDSYGDVGVLFPMEGRHLGIVHTIEMITGQDEHVRRAGGTNLEELFAHCIRRALVPGHVGGCLLGGPDLHPTGVESVEAVGIRNVAVKRDGVELGEHSDVEDAGVDAVADGDIDQAVLAMGTAGLERILVSG